MEGEILEMPQCISSVHMSTNQFGFSFAYDAPKVWNQLPGDIHSATSLLSFMKKLKVIFSQKPTHPRFHCNLSTVSVVWTPFYVFLFPGCCALGSVL